MAGENYDQVKEMCIFLLNATSLPPDKALAVYVQAPGSSFEFRGAVHVGCPSASLPLLWPSPGSAGGNTGPALITASGNPPFTAQIGVSVEDLATLPMLNVGSQKRVETLALKVGENLFNFMQSFCSVQGDKLIVPTYILDLWFQKFQNRAQKDPDYINRFTM